MTSPDSLAGLSGPAQVPAAPKPGSVEALLKKRWARLLIPSLSDLFFVSVMIALFLSGSGGFHLLLGDADSGWHIRTGEYILDHGVVPHQDLYSFSKAGDTWYAWEWLSDIFFAVMFRIGALKGVTLATALILVVYATTLMRRAIWLGANPLIAILVSLVSIGAATNHFLARPHIFTLLLLSISVWMIQADRKRASGRIWWLVPMTIVWTNLHGGFLALVAVLGLTAVGTAVEAWLGAGRTLRDAIRYLGLTVACMAASLVNPYGWNLHLHVVDYLQSDWIRSVIQEFQSPSFRSEGMLQFEVLLLLGLIVAATQFAQKRVVEGLWIVFWAHMALASVRHCSIFVTVVGPILALQLTRWWNLAARKASKNSLLGIADSICNDSVAAFRRTSILPVVMAVAIMFIGAPIAWPTDYPKPLFPVEIVNEYADIIHGARVLTSDQWGDYLIFKFPDQKVYIDGRSDFYGPEVGKEYMKVSNGHWDWRKILEKNKFDVVLIEPEMPISQLLKREPDWKVVADDGKAILMVRRDRDGSANRASLSEPRF